jgi:hypothetical protein
MDKKRRKQIRKEKRVGVRMTEQLYEAVSVQAYKEHKTISSLIIDLLVKYLGFEMPVVPPKNRRENSHGQVHE